MSQVPRFEGILSTPPRRRVSISTVQQVNDRAFFKRGNRWVDSSLMDKADATPKRIVTVGSEEFRQLAYRLAAQSRQGCVALSGEILLNVDGEAVLIRPFGC